MYPFNYIMNSDIIKLLNKCKIPFDNEQQLEGMLIPREVLLSINTYEKIKPEIDKIKKIFSSSSLTCLHQKAVENQKWPLLNLVRQILRACQYQMNPIRKSDGYTKDGKKKYKRFFLIKKQKDTKEII